MLFVSVVNTLTMTCSVMLHTIKEAMLKLKIMVKLELASYGGVFLNRNTLENLF